jgi:hypothetical protein
MFQFAALPVAVTGPARPAEASELDVGLLMLAYPQFVITAVPGRRRVRWEVVRRNSADPGLYAVITDSLAEAYTAMAVDASSVVSLPPASRPRETQP